MGVCTRANVFALPCVGSLRLNNPYVNEFGTVGAEWWCLPPARPPCPRCATSPPPPTGKYYNGHTPQEDPPPPRPPPPDQSDHRGKQRNLKSGKSSWAILVHKRLGPRPPPPSPPPLLILPLPPPAMMVRTGAAGAQWRGHTGPSEALPQRYRASVPRVCRRCRR